MISKGKKEALLTGALMDKLIRIRLITLSSNISKRKEATMRRKVVKISDREGITNSSISKKIRIVITLITQTNL